MERNLYNVNKFYFLDKKTEYVYLEESIFED